MSLKGYKTGDTISSVLLKCLYWVPQILHLPLAVRFCYLQMGINTYEHVSFENKTHLLNYLKHRLLANWISQRYFRGFFRAPSLNFTLLLL